MDPAVAIEAINRVVQSNARLWTNMLEEARETNALLHGLLAHLRDLERQKAVNALLACTEDVETLDDLFDRLVETTRVWEPQDWLARPPDRTFKRWYGTDWWMSPRAAFYDSERPLPTDPACRMLMVLHPVAKRETRILRHHTVETLASLVEDDALLERFSRQIMLFFRPGTDVTQDEREMCRYGRLYSMHTVLILCPAMKNSCVRVLEINGVPNAQGIVDSCLHLFHPSTPSSSPFPSNSNANATTMQDH